MPRDESNTRVYAKGVIKSLLPSMFHCYVLYSPKLDRYYTGETEDLLLRLAQHNTGFFARAYTKLARDWQIFISIKCKDREEARKLESFIKKQKSRKFIESLKSNPDKLESLVRRVLKT